MYMKLFTDGACSNNQRSQDKRQMRIAVTDDDGTVLVEKTMKELWAITEAMLFAKRCAITDLEIFTDSQNNLRWLTGRVGDGVNDRTAVLNLLKAINNARRHVTMTATWIPRKQNVAGIYLESSPNRSKPIQA